MRFEQVHVCQAIEPDLFSCELFGCPSCRAKSRQPPMQNKLMLLIPD